MQATVYQKDLIEALKDPADVGETHRRAFARLSTTPEQTAT